MDAHSSTHITRTEFFPFDEAARGRQAASTPHDAYFRDVFQQPQPARDLVVAVEPQSISFVDERLSEHRSDLLVTLRTTSGWELALYLLFENKSRNEHGTIFQIMRYNAVALGRMAVERSKQSR